MRVKTGFISLVIEQKLKDGLDKAKQRDGNKLTWHLERAIRNYLKAKKIIKE